MSDHIIAFVNNRCARLVVDGNMDAVIDEVALSEQLNSWERRELERDGIVDRKYGQSIEVCRCKCNNPRCHRQ